jgi:hypothetical protein
MSNQNKEVLNLGPVEQFEVNNDGLMLYNGNPLTYKELEKMASTARTQGAGILAVQEKTKRVQMAIGEISVSGVEVFADTIGKLFEIRDKYPKSSEHYRWVASFVEQVGQEYGVATLQAIRIGEKWLLQIIYASPFPPPTTQRRAEQRTWLGRLLLGSNDGDGYDDY